MGWHGEWQGYNQNHLKPMLVFQEIKANNIMNSVNPTKLHVMNTYASKLVCTNIYFSKYVAHNEVYGPESVSTILPTFFELPRNKILV